MVTASPLAADSQTLLYLTDEIAPAGKAPGGLETPRGAGRPG
jgi:hypothetical protein